MKKIKPQHALLMILLNYIPLLHIISILACLCCFNSWTLKIISAICVIYVLPILFVRTILSIYPLKENKFYVFSKDYFVWWATFCWQTIFLRFPFIEEILRSIPSLYSFWLRCWGSKIGKLVYWTPGTIILDRSFLNIGDHVIFGAGVRINAHIQDGDTMILAPITVEDNVVVGGYSLLTSGTILKKDQTTKSFLISPPFSVWKDNKRIFK